MDTELIETTNQNSVKVPKVVKPSNKKTLKTLGTSVIKSCFFSLSVRKTRFWGILIFSAPIQDRRLNFLSTFPLRSNCFSAAYTNNEINSKKITKPIVRGFQLSFIK